MKEYYSLLQSILAGLGSRLQKNDIFTRAGALSFTSIVSLIPIFALGYVSFSFLGGFEKLQFRLEDFLVKNFAPSFANEIQEFILNVKDKLSVQTIGLFGVFMLLFTSVITLAKIEKSFNLITGVIKGRKWIRKIFLYWTLISLGPVCLAFSFLFTKESLNFLGLNGSENFFTTHIIPYLATSLLFTVLYWFLPNKKIKFSAAFSSALIVSIVFEFLKLTYSKYAILVFGNSVYGSLAIFPFFLFWLYFCWVLVLLGMELCVWFQYAWQNKKIMREDTSFDCLLFLDILELIHRANLYKDRQYCTYLELMTHLNWSPRELNKYLYYLRENNIIAQIKDKITNDMAFMPVHRDKNKSVQHFFASYTKNRYHAQGDWAKSLQGAESKLFSS